MLHLLLLAVLVAPQAVWGQQALDEVESLLAGGMIFQARDRLAAWWDQERDQARRMEIQRGIWLRGKLTVDPSLAVLDYRRLTLEYPGGPFTDDAVFRLAQLAEMNGDLSEALASYGALERDYPESPFRELAREWIQEHGEEAELWEATGDPEVEPVSDPITGVGETPTQSGEEGSISVQLGAFRNLAGARQLRDDLVEAGFEARLVQLPGSALIRVRVGYLQTRARALELQDELARRGWNSTLVSDVQQEERVG